VDFNRSPDDSVRQLIISQRVSPQRTQRAQR
jgi:hypothetical protein